MILRPLLSLVALSAFSGCIIPSTQTVPNLKIDRHIVSKDPHRIEIFFDGTKNKWDSRTNVRRRFEMVAAAEDPHLKCFYVDGVGNDSWTAAALGIGMKARVVEGYKFLATHWTPGTKVRIFGFSRGAFQARMLAGMMAHSGLPTKHADGSKLSVKEIDRIAEEIWDYSRDHLEEPDVKMTEAGAVELWTKALRENHRKTKTHIDAKLGLSIHFTDPQIEFLGVWDTVPGLSLTELHEDGTQMEKRKNRTGKRGTRYKVRPYPNTKVIVHALALDEKRNKFAPVRVGGPLNPNRTTVHEVWFPGAHSDIGGGYADSNDLAGITFTWVQELLRYYKITNQTGPAYSDATSVLHHPEARRFYRLVGGTNRRKIPAYSFIDKTVFIRAKHPAPPEQAGRGYARVPYRPELTLDNGKVVKIKPSRDPAGLLGEFLYLNDSKQDGSKQKKVLKPVEPENLQLEVIPTKEEPAPKADPNAGVTTQTNVKAKPGPDLAGVNRAANEGS